MYIVRLLGPPSIDVDGSPARSPRGRKAWALLSYLLLAERPPSRRHLAELLFADADDPLGALRWTLAELRRSLGAPPRSWEIRSPPLSMAGSRWTYTCWRIRTATRPRCSTSAVSCSKG
ncbi:AfsR/SARP family transcriptional regulator [Phytohabitans houttuyneae]|uniref:OmpR/PhoB-type domain-containing protein n=1 Tax=Phytohabitans houttuyneae TaxID=1076126 RepID=A0A6V8KU77_9ACTN|nr:hypothetical protein [Phytohabitans houttuyneae]GFJ85891.1 hypothetical protein Phou_100710 [Phytohabitans houttuyneae]